MKQRVRAGDLREAIADALYPINVYQLPRICERYGLAGGDVYGAMGSKRWYVLRRVEQWETPRLVSSGCCGTWPPRPRDASSGLTAPFTARTSSNGCLP